MINFSQSTKNTPHRRKIFAKSDTGYKTGRNAFRQRYMRLSTRAIANASAANSPARTGSCHTADAVIAPKPIVAGNAKAAYRKNAGSMEAGNMMPESMTDGRNRSIAAIVCFACERMSSPSRHPAASVTHRSAASEQNHRGRPRGSSAPNAGGATARMMRQTISVCRKQEMNYEDFVY